MLAVALNFFAVCKRTGYMPGAVGAAALGPAVVPRLAPVAVVAEGVEGAEPVASLSGQPGALQQIAQHLSQGSSRSPYSLACRYYTAGPSSRFGRLAPGALGSAAGEGVVVPFAAFAGWQL